MAAQKFRLATRRRRQARSMLPLLTCHLQADHHPRTLADLSDHCTVSDRCTAPEVGRRRRQSCRGPDYRQTQRQMQLQQPRAHAGT